MRFETPLKLVFLGLVFALGSCASKSKAVQDASTMDSTLMISDIVLTESSDETRLEIQANQEPKFNVFKLTDPHRVVIDLIDAKLDESIPGSLAGQDIVQEVRVEALEDSLSALVRLEIFLKQPTNYMASTDGSNLVVRLLKESVTEPDESTDLQGQILVPPPMDDSAPLAEVAPVEPEVPPVEALPVEPEVPPVPEVISEVPLETPMAEPQLETQSESMAEAPAPAPVEPTPEAGTEIAAVPVPAPLAEEPVEEPVKEEKKEEELPPMPLPDLQVEAEAPKPAPVPKAEIPKGVESQEVPAAEFTEGTSLLTELNSKVYTGKRVSLEFQDADVHDVLRLIADVSKLNIITGDDVKGSLTLKLIDVPWDQALDIILTTLSLDKVQHGNILRVAPTEKLKKEREVALANDKAAKQLEPLRLKLININYATGDEMAARIKNLLSERGTVDIDSRTNTLIVKDIREHLTRIENLIKALDTQTPQVRIESRIVQADDTFSRSIGIQWGPTLNLSETNSRQRGWMFPRNIQVGTADTGFMQPSASQLGSFAVDALPGGTGQSSLGFRLGSISSIFNLDLQLAYAEAEQVGRIISRPSISVLDNKTAHIIQGQKIPFLSSSSDGSNVQFQDAGIEITVTPHITNDGSVSMKIDTKSNEPAGGSVGGNPIVSIREASTEMLVKSGHTAVLGGVFKTTDTRSEAGVPGLMHLPILGWLFKGRQASSLRAETLVFITPFILSDVRDAAISPSSATQMEP